MTPEFKGKLAFITGGANGVGLGQAKVFGRAGCKVIITDINQDRLQQALAVLKEENIQAHSFVLDVTDRLAVEQVAKECEARFGTINLLFNTAGVSIFGALEKATYDDYDWQMGVNFGGTVNCIVTFLPRMLASGESSWILNTASLSALQGSPLAGIYCASKFAVLGLSESLEMSLAGSNVGVSCLLPANVNSNIAECASNRPSQFANSGHFQDPRIMACLKELYSAGMDPEVLAEKTRQSMEKGDFYIIPYPEVRSALKERFTKILDSIPLSEENDKEAEKRIRAFQRYRQTMQALLNEAQ